MLRIELLGDGGIRVEPPTGRGGLASERKAREWVDAAGRGDRVVIAGAVASPIHADLVASITAKPLDVSVEASNPEPWNDGWTSLQVAANSGLTEEVEDLVGRGAGPSAPRGARSPYRLAMRHGHVDTLAALRRLGAAAPPGSQPPASLPNAVVLRNYLPSYVRWVAIGCAAVGIGLAVALWHWAFLLIAVGGLAMVVVGNAVIGVTRIAVDEGLLAVRQVLRWQGPIDVGDLVAIGYAPAVSLRMSGRWRFVQRSAGPPLRRSAHHGFEPELAEQLARRDDLRVVTVYCGRGYLSPGFQCHLAPYVRQSSALVSTTVEQVFAHVETPNFGAEQTESDGSTPENGSSLPRSPTEG
jgi:hypothetical protein